MRILIADDDPLSSRLMQKTLERRGYEVVTVSDGRAAATELNKPGGPKLALLDWMMPAMDGLEVCRAVRRSQNDSYVYILLLTSKQTTEDMVAGLEAGADDYLTKPFNPAELHARLLTGQRILSLEEKLVQAREGMRFRATYDSLTGLLNRPAILTRLQHRLEKLHREEAPFSLLLCDVDHFKKVNDLYGHDAGDSVLQEVAARFRGAVRARDYVGRYGGEEFLLLLQDCGPATLPSRAEQIRCSICTKPIEVQAGFLETSVSIGAASVTREHMSLRATEIIKRADEALYVAKAEGRNCVRIGKLSFARSSGSHARASSATFRNHGAAKVPLAERLLGKTLHRSSSEHLVAAEGA